jgi:hypothetical protein
MTKQVLSFAVIALLGIQCPLGCQDGPKEMAKIEIENVNVISFVNIFIIVRTSDKPLFIPYCGESEGGQMFLCSLGTELQVQSADGWHTADLETRYGVLSGVKMSKGIMITSNSKTQFIYQFARRYYKVEPGQVLRLVVKAWRDKKSMDLNDQIISLTSLPFKCPHVAIS